MQRGYVYMLRFRKKDSKELIKRMAKTMAVRYLKFAEKCSIDVYKRQASAFVGSLRGGKSFCNNLLVYYSVLFGGQAVILDPKSERGNWKETLPEICLLYTSRCV